MNTFKVSPARQHEALQKSKRRFPFAIVLLSVALVSVVVVSLCLYPKALSSKYDEGFVAGKASRDTEVSTLEHNLTIANNRLDTIEAEYTFFHQYAVIVTSASGSKYHHYGCSHLYDYNNGDGLEAYKTMKTFNIYNISAAKAKGYTQCEDCKTALSMLKKK